MPAIRYVSKNFSAEHTRMIETARAMSGSNRKGIG